MNENKCSSCGDTKKECPCKNKDFTKAVIEIHNPSQITLMRKVTIPANMGDDTVVPPEIGKYHNVLLYYEANHKAYLYSSDGIPTQLANGITDYEEAVNLPQINGVTLKGDKTAAELGLANTYTFDDIDSLKEATSLTVGQYAKTTGTESSGDGRGTLYRINDQGVGVELDNGLFAEVIRDFGGDNYYNIDFTTERINDTTVYTTTIPLNDENNELIPVTLDVANLTPSKYAQNNNTSVTFNGVAWVDSTHQYGSTVSNGDIVENVDTSDLPDCYYYIGIKSDRTLSSFQARTTTAQNLVDAGCLQAFMAYWKLVENGVAQNFSAIGQQLIDGSGVVNNPHPRQAIGVKADGTILVVTCDGRTPLDKGLTSSELATIMISKGCVNAWNMDGGGSATTVIKGSKINKSVDRNGTAERTHRYVLDVKRPTIDNQLAKAYSNTGKSVNDAYNKLLPIAQQSVIAAIDNNDIDNLMQGQSVKLSNHTINPPSTPASYYVVSLPHPDPQYRGLYGMQLAFNRQGNDGYTRRIVNGNMLEWQPLLGYYHTAYTLEDYIGTLTSTYEPIPLDSSFSNIANGIVPNVDQGAFTSFTVMCNDADRFEVSISVGCSASTSGAKYVSLYVDDVQMIPSTAFQHCESGNRATISTTFYLPVSLANKSIQLKVYGDVGDRWIRPKICLRQVQ